MIVEVGFKLNNDFYYYDKLLVSNGLHNCFNCLTHDIYYTNRDLVGLSENQMKSECIRIRMIDAKKGRIENTEKFNLDIKGKDVAKLKKIESKLINLGFYKVFDTKKSDHHYIKDGMNSRIQLQEIEDIGLLVYYDNSLYYDLPIDDQRNKLIDELNSYGFSFKYSDLGLDKLRTLYYKIDMYSKNQNG